MEQLCPKTVAQSRTEQVHVIMPPHLNGAGRLFGGQLALWIDIVAGVVASRHCNRQIITAAMDNLRFREPAVLGQLVVMVGKVTWVGNTSMEVRVDSFVEDLSGERRLINTAFLIQVALDESGRPCKVPPLQLESDQERAEFAAGEKRREVRRKLNAELYD